MKKVHAIAAAIAAAFVFACGAASAQEQTIFLGAVHVDVFAKMPNLSGPFLPAAAGAQLEIGSVSTLGFGYAYRFLPQWSVELALGVPPTHKVYGAGALSVAGQVANVEELPPEAFINYHWSFFGGRFNPLLGLGLNYTHFSPATSTAAGNAVSGGPTTISLSDSFGLAWHTGFTLKLDSHWSLAATVGSADVRSKLVNTTTLPNGVISAVSTDITFRPLIYSVSTGYSF